MHAHTHTCTHRHIYTYTDAFFIVDYVSRRLVYTYTHKHTLYSRLCANEISIYTNTYHTHISTHLTCTCNTQSFIGTNY